MSFPDKEKCLTTLKPFQSILSEIPHKALKAYQKDRLSKITTSGRVKSNSIWGYMIYYARRALGNNPRVQFVEHFGTVSIVIDEIAHRLLFRMKKSDRRGLSSNIQTKLSDAFHDHSQRQIFLLPDIDPDRIEIVYTLDSLGVRVDDVRVVARHGKQIIWAHSIKPKAKIIKSPVTPPSQKDAPGRARVRGDLLKKNKEKQGG